MTKPLISIVVPIYDVEKFLPRCIDSILNQTYQNLEIFLVDDGSPDNCGCIADKYAIKDNRINVIHKENGGLSDARNVAIEKATGEYITFVDSDDYIANDYIEVLYSLIEKYHAEISIGSWKIFQEDTIPKKRSRKVYELKFNQQEALSDMFYQNHFDVSAWVKLYKRDLFNDVKFPKGELFEDLQTTFKLFLKCNTIAFSSCEIYFYMLRFGSIEGSAFSEKKMRSAINTFKLMKSYEKELVNVKNALISKLVSFSFHLILKMPEGYQDGTLLIDYIRNNRLTVLKDIQSRSKTKLACIVSFFGFKVVKKAFTFVDRR